MFDKLKDAYNMRDQARKMQAALNAEKVTGVPRDSLLQISINGSFDVLEVAVAGGRELTK